MTNISTNPTTQTVVTSPPKFSWAILTQRVATFGVGGFAAAFVASYQQTSNWHIALSNAIGTLIFTGIFGIAWDQSKFQDSVRGVENLLNK